MKTLYIDCGMGAAGDMLTAALLELHPNPSEFIDRLNQIGIPGVTVSAEPAVKCGITGTHISVRIHGVEEGEHTHHHHEHDHGHTHHHHSSMHDIEHILSHLHISEQVRKDVMAVYTLIAEAESKAHGKPVKEIHFHEVGTMDAVADITAVCMLIEELSIDRMIASPVHVGSGQVKCAHGILPVPAPATAHILRGCPIYSGNIHGELCTPTGAALLKYFVSEFGEMPVMTVEAIGYGMGKKDFEAANCVRVMLGETKEITETVSEIFFNVDDMSAEDIAFAMERIYEANAREVFTIPVGMKKNRPGTLCGVICDHDDKEQIVSAIFKYTTTIGMRENISRRYTLERKIVDLETPWGIVREKISSGYGIKRSKYEFEDLARIAREEKISIDEIRKKLTDEA